MRRKQPKHLLYGSIVLLIVAFVILAFANMSSLSPLLPLPTPTPLTADAERVVLRMYEAINAKRPDEYMKTVLLRKHSDVQPMNVLRAITTSGNVGAFGLGVDWDKLEETMYYSVTVTGSLKTEIYVLVEARGRARYTTMDRDVDFCELWDARRTGEQWLVDIEAEERQARLDALVRERVAKYPILAWLRQQFNITIDLDGLLMQWGIADEAVYNMCE